MSTASAGGPGYWSEETPDPRRSRAREVLEAVRSYRTAESAMRRRTRESMRVGENDMLMVRYLVRAEGEGRPVTPGELARYLDITTASTTAIIDRLEKSGHVERRPNPTDRRSILVAATPDSHEEVRGTLGPMHDRMYAAAASFGPDESDVILRFLQLMQDAVDGVASDASTGSATGASTGSATEGSATGASTGSATEGSATGASTGSATEGSASGSGGAHAAG